MFQRKEKKNALKIEFFFALFYIMRVPLVERAFL